MDTQYNYLVHLLGWTLPVLLAQFVALFIVHRRRFGALMRAILVPVAVVTVWLVAGDHLAISAGIWRFDANQLTGIKLGAVPLEEALFFLITNLLVGFGLALFWRPRAPVAGTT